MVIWKFEIPITDTVEIEMPEGAELLSVANQNGKLCMWAMVDPPNERRFKRLIEVIGTGNPTPDGNRKFIGTVVINPYVWHVFERLS